MIINTIAANNLIDKHFKSLKKMGHIKEPEGIDFIINGKPLTEKQKKAISEFIQADKERLVKQKVRKPRTLSKKITN